MIRDTIRIVICGEEQQVPREMVGFHATVELGLRLGVHASGLALRRKADQTYLGASAPVGQVLQDGDELEFAPHPALRSAA